MLELHRATSEREQTAFLDETDAVRLPYENAEGAQGTAACALRMHGAAKTPAELLENTTESPPGKSRHNKTVSAKLLENPPEKQLENSRQKLSEKLTAERRTPAEQCLCLSVETALALQSVIAPAFYAVHRDVQAHGHTHYLLHGGRGSCKSTFVAVEVLLLLKQRPQCHALVLRKVAATLRDSVFSQYVWAAEMLGVAHEFEQKLAPPELVYKPTGQRILFRGADDKAKIKSLKMPFGYLGITHFEEKDQFDSRAELRTILQSTMRGGEQFWNFETCNPPPRPAHWANADARLHRADRLVHHSDYRTVPREWLGEQFFAEAALLQRENPAAYAHEYLGLATGIGASVFGNVRLAAIPDAQLACFDPVYYGVDWGFYPDPFAFIKAHYNAASRTLYVYDEVTAVRKSNRETAALIAAKGAGGACVWADAAEPKSIADFRSYGIFCRAAGKGPGSIAYSMKWLAGLAAIVIDPVRCPDTAREFAEYEHERDRAGEVTEGYPDRNNHHIDAVRYALYPVWRRKGQ